MKKLELLVDLDDTMEDLIPRLVSALNYKFSKEYTSSDITEWDLSKFYPGITNEDLIEAMSRSDFWELIDEKPQACEFIYKLKRDGHDIKVVTASHYSVLEKKMDLMFFRLFPFLTWDDVIITKDKRRVTGDVLIDDNPNFLNGFNGIRLLMDASHNRSHVVDSINTIRVHDWHEIYDIVSTLAEDDNYKIERFCQ